MNFITNILNALGWYPTIFFLMLLESTVVPVPSVFVVTPAAYHAASGSLNVFLVILFATLGADVGASINYFVALYVGRPVIYKFANSKWGKMCLLNQEKVEKSFCLVAVAIECVGLSRIHFVVVQSVVIHFVGNLYW